MSRRVIAILCLWLSLATVVTSHGLHLSIGKAEVAEKTISGKMTFNKMDFIEALDQWDADRPIYELSPEEFERLTLLYMKRHFKVEANGSRDLRLSITGASQGNETLSLMFEFSSNDTLREIRVEHRVLFGVFPDQGNVLEVTSESGRKSHLFRLDSPIAVFKL